MEEQILIFRTSVKNVRDIKHIAALFTLCPQIYKWNVDMENWEKVLRIECQGIRISIIKGITRYQHLCAGTGMKGQCAP